MNAPFTGASRPARAQTSTPLPRYWSMPVAAVEQQLGVTTAGLSAAEADQRLARFGPNQLADAGRHSALRIFAGQFKSAIIVILLLATAVSALLRDWVDAAIILAIVLGSALLSFYQEYSASNATARLRAQVGARASVLRDGQAQSVPAEHVVPGDVILLSAGSLVPADAILLEAKDFFVTQAVLTGETFPVEKMPGVVAADAALAGRTNMVFMGTNVRTGTGRALVVATGRATAFGQIADRLTLRAPETDFERGIRRLGYLLSEVMFVLVFAVFALNVLLQKPPLDSLLFSIALAVGLTPQLLPAIISVNLARGAQKMAQAGVIVRKLAAIENFGSMDILCTDKTGTLTEGVVQLDRTVNAEGTGDDRVLRLAWLNAHFQTGLVNPLDDAIQAKAAPDLTGVTKVDEIPYDFIRKRLSIVVDEAAQAGAVRRLIAKGAFEQILAVSTQVWADGKAVALDAARRAALEAKFAEWSGQGFRVLGVAERTVPEKPTYSRTDEADLVFAGCLLFFDPPKPGVQETIAALARLGVELKIITGDNRLVAAHTAQTLKLPVRGLLTGSDLETLRDEALWHAVEDTTIFAEVDPNEKERIILALQKRGHVVGYMGDGINDAPSLHAADVGISVNTAVDVAKEAADFVLLDKDLSVLEQGIVQGRRTFANTLKYIFMATSANFGNMFSMAGASVLLPFLPMLPKQILLINFMTDLPEMTIASDRVDDAMVQRPPRWEIGFIRRFMFVFGTISSVFDYLTFAMLLWLLHADQTLFHTGWFVESVISAVVVVFAVRTRLPFFRSRPGTPLLLAALGIVAATLWLPYSPVAGLLGFAPLPAPALALILVIVALYFMTAETAKHFFYRHEESLRTTSG